MRKHFLQEHQSSVITAGVKRNMGRQILFGAKIKQLRENKNISQQQLADTMFVSRSTIGNWESGFRVPDITMVSRLAQVLGVEIYELLDVMNDPDMPPKLIVVDDVQIILKGFVHMLEDTLPQAEIFGFQDSAEAIHFAESNRIDIAFLDIELSGDNGIDLARHLKTLNPRINIIFLTGHTEYAMEALDIYCSGYVLKPLTPEKIRNEISNLRYPVNGLSHVYDKETLS